MGCSEPHKEWVEGVPSLLQEEKIIRTKNPDKVWEKVYLLTTTGGRKDLVMLFGKIRVNLPKLASFRLGFGSCSWVSDYLVNYKSQH